jgi:23S rRNA (pseudouridine1915-N3)-methyltransferase
VRIRVIAVGDRMPGWVADVVGDYTRRLSGTLRIAVEEVPAGRRSARGDPAQAMRTEGQRILERVRPEDQLVVLDEHGGQMNTRELATWLAGRMQDGRDLVLAIGGPDGLADEVLARADRKLALSRLTLPHPLARVVLIEQLYRAHTLLSGHPYHRD